MSRRTILVCYFRFRINFLVRPQHWLSISRTTNKYSLPSFMNEKKVLRDSTCKFGILFKSFFALKVNIYLQNMSIKRCFGEIRPKTCIFVIFVCSWSPSIISYACPNFRITCAMVICLTTSAWVWTLSASFNSVHPTIVLVA